MILANVSWSRLAYLRLPKSQIESDGFRFSSWAARVLAHLGLIGAASGYAKTERSSPGTDL
jgi:hypothetical protein